MRSFYLYILFCIILLIACEDDNPVNYSNKVFINKVYPEFGYPQQEFFIIGKGFGTSENEIEVFLDDNSTFFWLLNDSLIKVQVPFVDTGYYQVTIRKNNKDYSANQKFEVYNKKDKEKTIVITSLSNEILSIGDTLKVYTRNYGVAEKELTLLPAGFEKKCIFFSDTLIKFIITPDFPNGSHYFSVRYYYKGALKTIKSEMQFTVSNSDISLMNINISFSNFLMKIYSKTKFQDWDSYSTYEKYDTLIRTFTYEFDIENSSNYSITNKSIGNDINYFWSDNGTLTGEIKFYIDFVNYILSKIIFSKSKYFIVNGHRESYSMVLSIETLNFKKINNNYFESYLSSTDLIDCKFNINYDTENYHQNGSHSSTEEITNERILSLTDSSSIKIALTLK
ncbi:MAG: IPT/TIG domain-containing protein [bacterium]